MQITLAKCGAEASGLLPIDAIRMLFWLKKSCFAVLHPAKSAYVCWNTVPGLSSQDTTNRNLKDGSEPGVFCARSRALTRLVRLVIRSVLPPSSRAQPETSARAASRIIGRPNLQCT